MRADAALEDKLACRERSRREAAAAAWRTLLTGKPTDVATMHPRGAVLGVTVQQSSADALRPTARQTHGVDCSFTTAPGGGLVAGALSWGSAKACSLTASWECPRGPDGRDAAAGTFSLLPRRKAASLELRNRRPAMLGGGAAKARLEAAQGEGLCLAAGPCFGSKGGSLTVEAQSDLAHRSHLHLGLRLGRPPRMEQQEQQERQQEQRQPPAAKQLGKLAGKARQGDGPLRPAAEEREQPRRAGRPGQRGSRPPQLPHLPLQGSLAASLEAHRLAAGGAAEPAAAPAAEHAQASRPASRGRDRVGRGRAADAGRPGQGDGGGGGPQGGGGSGGLEARCWLPAGSKGLLRWRASLQRALPCRLMGALGVHTAGRQHERRQCEARLWAPLGRGVQLTAEAAQQGPGRGTQASLRLAASRRGQAKWQCGASFSRAKGLQLSGKFGKEPLPAWLWAEHCGDRPAGRFVLGLAPPLRLARLSFAASLPL